MERRSGMRNVSKNVAQSVSTADIAVEIEHLSSLSLRDLRAAWAAEFRRDPPILVKLSSDTGMICEKGKFKNKPSCVGVSLSIIVDTHCDGDVLD